jgi:hypothetical protein
VIWRFGPVVVYAALAIVIGIAYGGRGLAILSFFYFWVGAWVVFALVSGRAARAAGRWNFRRLDTAPMGDESGYPAIGVWLFPPRGNGSSRRCGR